MFIGIDENILISAIKTNMTVIKTHFSTIDKFVEEMGKEKLKPMAAADADTVLVHLKLLKKELDEAEARLNTVSGWKKG